MKTTITLINELKYAKNYTYYDVILIVIQRNYENYCINTIILLKVKDNSIKNLIW